MPVFNLSKTVVYYAQVEADTLQEAIDKITQGDGIVSDDVTGTDDGDWDDDEFKPPDE